MEEPTILLHGQYDQRQLQELKSQSHWSIHDICKQQLAEYFEICHPDQLHSADFATKQQAYIEGQLIADPDLYGDWIYFPWSGTLLHMAPQFVYDQLRTNRNQLLVTAKEQRDLFSATVGVVGLSIGARFALTMAQSGIASHFKLAEFDALSSTNLNRAPANVLDIGKNKLDIVAQQIYALNPYQRIEAFPKGLNSETLDNFIDGSSRPDLIFEAVDDFAMKIQLRQAAREAGIPVVMLTNLGDTILVDVERYDLNKNTEIFNGAIGNTAEEILSHPLTEADKVRYAIKIVSFDYTPTRALQTLLQINKTLTGRPQLASTVVMGGGIAALVARLIILKQPLASGRYHLDFASWLNVADNHTEQRQRALSQLKQQFDL